MTVHAGLLPIPGVTLQRNLRLTAFDGSGIPLASTLAPVTAGTGFGTALTVGTASPGIASIVLEAENDPELLAVIAVQDFVVDGSLAGAQPDFVLAGPPGVTVVQGAAASTFPLQIIRIGGSTGDIFFTVTGLPAGAAGGAHPNPATGTTAALDLKAASGPPPEVKTVLITGIPSGPEVGTAPRTLAVDVATAPQIRVAGPAAIDLAVCIAIGARGTTTTHYSVTRDPSVSGPIAVAIEGRYLLTLPLPLRRPI